MLGGRWALGCMLCDPARQLSRCWACAARCRMPTTPALAPVCRVFVCAAAIVMRAVRNTVDTGRTVVCTIHQPALHVFDVSVTVFFWTALLVHHAGQVALCQA